MSALQPALEEAQVLDLFAGSGALGFETLSRGAAHVTFVERSAGALRAIEKNAADLGVGDAVDIVRGDALAYAIRLDAGAFDVVLADPPYATDAAAILLARFAQHPFAGQLWVEHRPGIEVPGLADAVTRRYGDTALTRVLANEVSR